MRLWLGNFIHLIKNNMKLFNKKTLLYVILTGILLYICSMAYLYCNQEKFYFHPKTLNSNYQYQFNIPFEEYDIKVDDHNTLNTLLFKSKTSKGVILYLHGNAGALHEWGLRAPIYTDNSYDVLFVDYRGFGKNKNIIKSEDMLHEDMQVVYNFLKTKYSENQITILGFSIGTGLAAKLAANNSPKQLILEAPYYSFESLINSIAPMVPSFLINYKIETYKFIKNVTCPVTIFHGKDDQLITPNENGVKLSTLIPNIKLHLIDKCHHNGIYKTEYYQNELKTILN